MVGEVFSFSENVVKKFSMHAIWEAFCVFWAKPTQLTPHNSIQRRSGSIIKFSNLVLVDTLATRDVEAEVEAGSGRGSAKNPPLPLPHRREEWRKKRNWFCSLS